jgi:hypothetical protein
MRVTLLRRASGVFATGRALRTRWFSFFIASARRNEVTGWPATPHETSSPCRVVPARH